MSPDASTIAEAAAMGMLPSLYAALTPDRPCVVAPRGSRTWNELDANANRLANHLRGAGLIDEHVALLCPNVPEFVEVFAAIMRSGLRLVPVNWHLKPEEASYIVKDSAARVVIAHADFPKTALAAGRVDGVSLRIAIGGAIDGFARYEDVLRSSAIEPLVPPRHGTVMLYTSGTTGRPKGVYRAGPQPRMPQWEGSRQGFNPDTDTCLCCGPAYHSAPLGNTIWNPLVSGVPIVMMERFDAGDFLRMVERRRVTHCFLVTAMFHRLLALPRHVRDAYDVSSLRNVLHGAAPTPPDVKRAMIDWFGPIVHEFYGASEATGSGYHITADEWLSKPGSVGRMRSAAGHRIASDAGGETAPYEVGEVQFRHSGTAPFRYFNHPAPEGEYFSVGDRGYLDEDGYLFLTGRSSDCIISGGVNVYPQEVDDQLMKHAAVREACTVGVPNNEFGEEVKGVVELNDGFAASDALAAELIAAVKAAIASYKAPRSIDFVDAIPRSPAGKILRVEVRSRYWAGRSNQI